jgi:hypothetical protein
LGRRAASITLAFRCAEIISNVGVIGLDELYGVYPFLSRLNDISGIEALPNELN